MAASTGGGGGTGWNNGRFDRGTVPDKAGNSKAARRPGIKMPDALEVTNCMEFLNTSILCRGSQYGPAGCFLAPHDGHEFIVVCSRDFMFVPRSVKL